MDPWDDKKLEDFLYYLCPECHFKAQESDDFFSHCQMNHPFAENFLYNEFERSIVSTKNEEIKIKENTSFENEPDSIEPQMNLKKEVCDLTDYSFEDRPEDSHDNSTNDIPLVSFPISNSKSEKKKILKKSSSELTGLEIDCETCGKTLRNRRSLQKHVQEVSATFFKLIQRP